MSPSPVPHHLYRLLSIGQKLLVVEDLVQTAIYIISTMDSVRDQTEILLQTTYSTVTLLVSSRSNSQLTTADIGDLYGNVGTRLVTLEKAAVSRYMCMFL